MTDREIIGAEQFNEYRSWLKKIEALHGVDLTLDDEGVCSAYFKRAHIVIEFPEESSNINIFSYLVELSTEDPQWNLALLMRGMELNAFPLLMEGGAIAATPECEFLIFRRTIPFESLNYDQFKIVLDQIFDSTENLKKMLGILD